MKLSKQKLYNLIQEVMETHLKCFEALEDYAKPEQSHFGDGIQQIMEHGSKMYKTFDGRALDSLWLTSHIGPRLGRGYSREVYQIGDSNMVLKVVFPVELKDGVASNRYEVDLFNKYPSVFPKTYVYDRTSSGPEWMVIQKAKVVEDGREYAQVIEEHFPSLRKAADLFTESGYDRIDPAWVFERLLDAYDEEHEEKEARESEEYDGYGKWLDAVFHNRRGRSVDDETKKKLADQAWFVATNDVGLMNFIMTCKELNVAFDEIREGNVGVVDSWKSLFVLIDISKFDFLQKKT